MQIFVLDQDSEASVQAYCDKHVNKILLEATQIANTALYINGLEDMAFYRKTHENHPWCQWAADSWGNMSYILQYIEALGHEFEHRFGGVHKSYAKMIENWGSDPRMADLLNEFQYNDSGPWETPQAVPEEYQQESPVDAYREYYKHEKATKDWFKFENGRDRPEWLQNL